MFVIKLVSIQREGVLLMVPENNRDAAARDILTSRDGKTDRYFGLGQSGM